MNKELSLASIHSNPLSTSIEQETYLNSGNYTIPTTEGHVFKRIRKLLAMNPSSGNILVKEKTYSDDYNYEKVIVVARDGKPEKFRGSNF